MEGESCNLAKNTDGKPSNMVHDGRTVLQPVRFRRGSVLVDPTNWKFVESEFRFVLYCGSLLWALYLLSLAF
jgi:hypothetical protein